jgi:hypothetical protein
MFGSIDRSTAWHRSPPREGVWYRCGLPRRLVNRFERSQGFRSFNMSCNRYPCCNGIGQVGIAADIRWSSAGAVGSVQILLARRWNPYRSGSRRISFMASIRIHVSGGLFVQKQVEVSARVPWRSELFVHPALAQVVRSCGQGPVACTSRTRSSGTCTRPRCSSPRGTARPLRRSPPAHGLAVSFMNCQ